ncbi:MAG: VOC family protein [Gemmatimonadaceae bacterium]|nr:VOC family protein [Gemmatimonadaceae bacterium]
MTTPSNVRTPATIYPSFIYRDAPAMIAWLERAFGFRRRLVVEGDERAVVHAELTLGEAVIMVSSPRADLNLRGAADLGATHAGCCCFVDDPDAHCARAVQEGAVVHFPLKDTDYGSREYTVRDPEGVMWTFGTYRPGAYWDGRTGS